MKTRVDGSPEMSRVCSAGMISKEWYFVWQ